LRLDSFLIGTHLARDGGLEEDGDNEEGGLLAMGESKLPSLELLE